MYKVGKHNIDYVFSDEGELLVLVGWKEDQLCEGIYEKTDDAYSWALGVLEEEGIEDPGFVDLHIDMSGNIWLIEEEEM